MLTLWPPRDAHFPLAVVFGRVLEGYDVVDTIQNLPVNRSGRPAKNVTVTDSGTL